MCISPSKDSAASESAESAIPAISAAAPSISFPTSSNCSSTTAVRIMTNAKYAPTTTRRRRFGVPSPPSFLLQSNHGISGSLSTLLTCAAIATLRTSPPGSLISTTASTLAAFASIVTASSGMSIVDHAPRQTIIMTRPIMVVPPHRDAFGRTSKSVYYLCARILVANVAHVVRCRVESIDHSGICDGLAASVVRWGCGISAVLYATNHFVPRVADVDWHNGNTYVFVLPMALGLSVDAFFQLPAFQCIVGDGYGGGTPCWNEDVITQLDLLCVLLTGLIVAFSFTLAFRGMLDIRRCYWGSAVVVYVIVAYLIARAMPFVSTFLR